LEDSALTSEAVGMVDLEVSRVLASIPVERGVQRMPRWMYFMNLCAR